jgi:hypothetical protein
LSVDEGTFDDGGDGDAHFEAVLTYSATGNKLYPDGQRRDCHQVRKAGLVAGAAPVGGLAWDGPIIGNGVRVQVGAGGGPAFDHGSLATGDPLLGFVMMPFGRVRIWGKWADVAGAGVVFGLPAGFFPAHPTNGFAWKISNGVAIIESAVRVSTNGDFVKDGGGTADFLYVDLTYDLYL